MKAQHQIPAHLQVEIEAASKGIDLNVVRRRLRMKASLFSLGKSGKRKRAHERILKFIRSHKSMAA